MSLLDIGRFGADFSVIMSLISCVLLLRIIPISDKRLKFFAGYLVLALAAGIISYFTRRQGNNAFLLYFHGPLSFILSMLIFMPKKKILRAIILSIGAIIILTTLYEAFVLEGGTTMYNSLSLTFSNITIGFLAINHIIAIRFDTNVFNLTGQPMFWIGIAFAIMNIANIISDGFYRTLQNAEGDILMKVALTGMAVNYIATIIYWIGLLKVKTPKDIAPFGKRGKSIR